MKLGSMPSLEAEEMVFSLNKPPDQNPPSDICVDGGCSGWISGNNSQCVYTQSSPPGVVVFLRQLDCECVAYGRC